MSKNILKPIKFSILILILVSSVILIGGIQAFFSDADSSHNKMTVGGNKIELIEDFQPPKELAPGVEFTKDVKVKNVGQSDCFVRIKAVFTDSDMEKYCSVDFNTDDYDYNSKDGFYYYKRILKRDEITPSLFTKVTLSDGTPINEIKDFDILVYTESYQSGSFTDYAEAWEYFSRNKSSN